MSFARHRPGGRGPAAGFVRCAHSASHRPPLFASIDSHIISGSRYKGHVATCPYYFKTPGCWAAWTRPLATLKINGNRIHAAGRSWGLIGWSDSDARRAPLPWTMGRGSLIGFWWLVFILTKVPDPGIF